MKYVIETTPEEQGALYGMIERVVGRFCDTVVELEKLRGARHRASPVVVTDAPATAQEPVDTSKVIRFDRHERPTGADVGRGDDRGLVARDETPLPSETLVDEKKLRAGRAAFDSLVRLWVKGFGIEGEEQPDRAEAMRSLANSQKSFAVLAYVKDAGGVTWAVNASSHFAPTAWETEELRRKCVLEIAGNITQVASILFPDLSDLYEYKDIFAKYEEDGSDE